jgi:hypothetical protein
LLNLVDDGKDIAGAVVIIPLPPETGALDPAYYRCVASQFYLRIVRTALPPVGFEGFKDRRPTMIPPDVRKGMPPRKVAREAFEQRFKSRFIDPAFAPLQRELQAITNAAWDAYEGSRKAPMTRKAGPGFADPDYEIAVDWLAARAAIEDAQRRYDDPAAVSRILIVNGSSRTEHTCPGEMSKSWRLVEIARDVIATRTGFEIEVLDLGRTTSEYGRTIHPCKSCVSTSMALCHWPCSCYPNYSLGQAHDWMNEIYPLWVAAHGVMIITPVNW